jgi:lysozyme
MNVSQRGLDLLKSFEGLRLHAYDDGTGTWTIGHGLTFYPDSGRKVQQGDEIDAEAAEELFAAAVGDFAADVGRLVHVPLSQQQFDALTSLAYNIGTGALEKSTLLQKLNAGDYYGAADEFNRWNKAGGVTLSGLVKRRAAERALFLEGTFHPKLGTNVPTKPANESQTMPIAPILAAVLPTFLEAAPKLIRIFGDGKQSDKNARAAQIVADIAKEATGATNEQAAAEVISRDPKAAEAFQGLVQARWFELTEVGGGVQEARAFTERLIGLPDWRGVGFSILMGVLALTIVFGGGLMLWSLLQDPATPPEQKGMVLGAIIATIGAPVAFFFGSSASSRAKDQALIDRR